MRAVFNIALVIVIATPIVLAPLLGLLGRRYWFFTGPRRRLIVVSFVLLVLMIIAVPLGPWTTGLQWGWFSSVDARYFLCIDQNFGAQGLLMGYVSPGQSAISQWPAMIGILAAGALIGLLLGLGLQALAARWAGIRRKAASGGES